MKKIYLDNHATTKPLPEAVEEANKYYSDYYGNPASLNTYGEQAKSAVERAKEEVAREINADPEQIYFVSSATEANNIVVKGFYERHNSGYVRIITTNSEHSSVLESLKELPEEVRQRTLKIDHNGNIPYELISSAIGGVLHWDFHHPCKFLVSVIAANNEIGTIHDLKRIGEQCGDYTFFHTDATQAIGKVKIDVKDMKIDALTFSGHKIHGLKGVGALYLKDASQVKPLISGGFQSTVSSGTQNVPAIVALGSICEYYLEDEEELKRIKHLRDTLLANLEATIPDVMVNGTMLNRLPNNLNVSFIGVPAEALLMGLDDIAISSGSACGSGKHKPSHVIKALEKSNPEEAIRFGLSRFTTAEEIEYTSERIKEVIFRLRRQA